MHLKDFYSPPYPPPVTYSNDFWKKNRKEILAHQKNFRIIYPPFFRIKRFFYLIQSQLTKKFFIGQASFSGLGDTVLYSHLPRLIKSRWPNYKVFIYETEFSKVVFANNPFIDGFTKDKQYLWRRKGSGSDYGSGHFTQMKARFMGIKECLPKGEIFINPEESNKAIPPPPPVNQLRHFMLMENLTNVKLQVKFGPRWLKSFKKLTTLFS